MIKLFSPYFDKNEKRAIVKTLESGMWASGAGIARVDEFENAFKKYTGSDECISLNSGTAALNLALSILNIKNKEVLVPSLTFVSTVSAILLAGAKPVFVDANEETLCVDTNDLEKKITRKTSLILPVHFGGLPCNLSEIKRISKRYNIPVVEDAAHACGAKFSGKKIGTHNEIVCFSFHPVKNLSMPTGGAITLNGRTAQKRKRLLKSLRWCGIDNRKGVLYDVPRLGWNYYMNEFSATIGLQQLKKLDWMNNRRKFIAKMYHEGILSIKKIPLVNDSSYHLYWIRVKKRSRFIKFMNSAGIEVGVHYRPIHLMTAFKSMSSKSLPITDSVWPELVSIPMHTNLTNVQVKYIIKKINEFHNES